MSVKLEIKNLKNKNMFIRGVSSMAKFGRKAIVKCCPDILHFHGLDDSNTNIVEFDVDSTMCSSLECKGRFSIQVDLGDLWSTLSTLTDDEELLVESLMENDVSCLRFQFKDALGRDRPLREMYMAFDHVPENLDFGIGVKYTEQYRVLVNVDAFHLRDFLKRNREQVIAYVTVMDDKMLVLSTNEKSLLLMNDEYSLDGETIIRSTFGILSEKDVSYDELFVLSLGPVEAMVTALETIYDEDSLIEEHMVKLCKTFEGNTTMMCPVGRFDSINFHFLQN